MKITERELFWLVGILEGEGHFRFYTTQEIVLTMTDEDVMMKAALIFGKLTGEYCSIKERPRLTTGGLTAYNINLCGQRARIVMQAVVRHMGDRRRQAIWRSLNRVKVRNRLEKEKSKQDLFELMGLSTSKESA